MRTLISILILSSVIYSCGTKSDTTDKSAVDKTNNAAVVDTAVKDFAVFWQTFRKAILDYDTTTIISLTKFPIETRGPMDEDPIIKYSKNNFVKILNLYLDQDSGLGEGSELDYIKKTDTPKKDDSSHGWSRIGDMQFTFSDNRWTLTFMYLTPLVIETINKNGW